MTPFAKMLSDLRKHENVTEAEIAVRMGVSQAAVSQYENGLIMPRPARVVALAKAYKLNVTETLAQGGFLGTDLQPYDGPIQTLYLEAAPPTAAVDTGRSATRASTPARRKAPGS